MSPNVQVEVPFKYFKRQTQGGNNCLGRDISYIHLMIRKEVTARREMFRIIPIGKRKKTQRRHNQKWSRKTRKYILEKREAILKGDSH